LSNRFDSRAKENEPQLSRFVPTSGEARLSECLLISEFFVESQPRSSDGTPTSGVYGLLRDLENAQTSPTDATVCNRVIGIVSQPGRGCDHV
jgi:hypothetical protein